MDYLELLSVLTELKPLLEKIEEVGIDLVSNIANEYWNPKWARKQAKYYATFFNTLIKQGMQRDEAMTTLAIWQIANREALEAFLRGLNKIETSRRKEE